MLISLSLYACDRRGVEKENLNNNGAGADQDGTATDPDTMAAETADTLLNPGKAPGPARIDSVLTPHD